jgi:hypothetical protein
MRYAPQEEQLNLWKQKLDLHYSAGEVFSSAVELSKDFIENPNHAAALAHDWAELLPKNYLTRNYKKNPNILKDVLENLAERNLDLFEQAAIIQKYAHIDKEQHEINKKIGLEEVIGAMLDEMLDEMQEEGMPSTGRGGQSSNDFYRGRGVSWDKEFPPIPIILKSEFMKFATQASEDSPQTKGKPKEDVLVTRLTSLSQLPFASAEDLCLPDDAFFEKLAGGKLMVKIPMKTVGEKRTLVVLIDDSGSMDHRVDKVQNVLNELFTAVISSNLRLLIAPFEYLRGKFFEISNEDQIKEFKNMFTAGSGGDTFLGDILPPLFREIESGQIDSYSLPKDSQLLIINDGQDDISWIPTLPLVVHAVTVAGNNKELLALCARSKGEYLNIG